MKISYVTDYDASDVGNWSGTGTYVARTLAKNNFALNFIGPLPRPRLGWPMLKAKGFFYNRLSSRRFHAGHSLIVARNYAARVERLLRKQPETDLVFSPGTIPLALVNTDKPTAFWTDATHGALFDFYPEYSGLCAESLRDGHLIDQRALDKAGAAIFSSQWAADSAIRIYNADPEKVHVVPFGANLDSVPSPAQLARAIRSRTRRSCKLLFIGVDWFRKGGETALAVARELNDHGLPTELTIAGCNPFAPHPPPPFVRCEGFLSKRSKEGVRRLEQLLAESHFLIVPSLAECFGIVYCEANAYGVPCLARSVGGVPSIIRNGINGQLFDPAAPPEAYARLIEEQFHDFDRYLDLAFDSAHEYADRLNWEAAGKQVRSILSRLAQPKGPVRV